MANRVMIAGLASIVALVAIMILGASMVEAKDAVKLQDIEVLTFTKGDYTKGRRRSAVPQMKCIGGGAKGLYEPNTAMCKNIGFDGRDVAWKCETDLPAEYSLGKVTVTCEGYDFPEDSYVLKDSCGLEYNLEYSHTGTQRTYQDQHPHTHTRPHVQTHDYVKDRGFFGNLFHTIKDWIVTIISLPFDILGWIASFFFKTGTTLFKLFVALSGIFIGLSLFRAITSRRGKKIVYPKAADRPVRGMGPAGLAGGSKEDGSTGPGFWTGVLGGGLASYFMTRRSNKDTERRPDGTWNHVPSDMPANAPIPPAEHESTAYGTTKRR